MHPEFETERLRLRAWREEDLAPFAALNADPEVMELFPSALTRAESDAFVERIQAHWAAHGFGLWATQERASRSFIGFVGLAIPRFEAHFTPCVEVGWRLARAAWGHGYASEAARAALRCGFDDFDLEEIVSFTVPMNTRSRSVMEKLGLTHDPADDFDHPDLPEGHRLRRHVLYRMARSTWRETQAQRRTP